MMRLDVLPSPATMDPMRILALADQAYADFCAAGTDVEQIDLGLAVCSPHLSRVFDANRIFLARVPRGMQAEQLWQSAQDCYAKRNSRCWRVMLSRLAADDEKLPLVEVLKRQGWREKRCDILRLEQASARHEHTYKIISARAAMRLYEPFAREAAASIQPQLADASIARLDDPQYEALVAIVDGKIVARAALMTSGEVGLIEQVHVLEAHRGQGYARAVVQAAIDLAGRAMFKHVMLACEPNNMIAQNLYASLGFKKLGDEVSFCDPDTFS